MDFQNAQDAHDDFVKKETKNGNDVTDFGFTKGVVYLKDGSYKYINYFPNRFNVADYIREGSALARRMTTQMQSK